MQVEIISVGKLKKEFQILENFYLKRLKQFSKIKLIEIKEKNIDWEGEQIISKIKKDFLTVLFSPDGKAIKTDDFFYRLISDNARIQFIIGGSTGVCEEVFNSSDKVVSISQLIFPHQLFKCMVLEQIYRGYSIFNDHPYHKV